jgi:hypothetical protein
MNPDPTLSGHLGVLQRGQEGEDGVLQLERHAQQPVEQLGDVAVVALLALRRAGRAQVSAPRALPAEALLQRLMRHAGCGCIGLMRRSPW